MILSEIMTPLNMNSEFQAEMNAAIWTLSSKNMMGALERLMADTFDISRMEAGRACAAAIGTLYTRGQFRMQSNQGPFPKQWTEIDISEFTPQQRMVYNAVVKIGRKVRT